MIDIASSLASCGRQYHAGMVKIQEDASRYEEIFRRTKPDVVVETGSFSMKAALWMSETADCDVITVDTNHDSVDPEIWSRIKESGRIYTVLGSSTDQLSIDLVRALIADLGSERVMVSLDSDHSAGHVALEMDLYGPLVPVGGYMVVEDTLLRWMPPEERAHYQGTPMDAVEEFMYISFDEWAYDGEIEGMSSVTQFPRGWLKRIAPARSHV